MGSQNRLVMNTRGGFPDHRTLVFRPSAKDNRVDLMLGTVHRWTLIMDESTQPTNPNHRDGRHIADPEDPSRRRHVYLHPATVSGHGPLEGGKEVKPVFHRGGKPWGAAPRKAFSWTWAINWQSRALSLPRLPSFLKVAVDRHFNSPSLSAVRFRGTAALAV